MLDARLDGRERAEILAHLAANEDAYQLFACLATILRQMEDEDARVDTTPDGVVAHHRLRLLGGMKLAVPLRWIAFAAVLTGVAIAPGRALEVCALEVCALLPGDPVPSAAVLATGDMATPWRNRPMWESAR